MHPSMLKSATMAEGDRIKALNYTEETVIRSKSTVTIIEVERIKIQDNTVRREAVIICCFPSLPSTNWIKSAATRMAPLIKVPG